MTTLVLLAMLAQDKAPDPLPEGDGKKLVVKICTDCHGADQIVAKRRTKEEWDDVISDMIQKGAEGKGDEFDAIVAYLVKNFGR
jgi:competence protein ComEA